MNDQEFENKVNRDVDKTRKDLATLGKDSLSGLSRVLEQLAANTKKTVAVTGKAFNKAVGHGLSQYNKNVQNVADKVPGGFSKKVAGYPWVTITLSLVFGLLLGAFLKPGRQSVG